MSTQRPPAATPTIYVVRRPNGETFTIDREPLGGIAEWAKGQNVVVLAYAFAAVVYDGRPAPKTAG